MLSIYMKSKLVMVVGVCVCVCVCARAHKLADETRFLLNWDRTKWGGCSFGGF